LSASFASTGATVGTTLAPWGLAFIQSYAAVLLPLHVIALLLLARDQAIVGEARPGKGVFTAGWVSAGLILACVGALAWSWIESIVPA
jgi:hypothetical protein